MKLQVIKVHILDLFMYLFISWENPTMAFHWFGCDSISSSHLICEVLPCVTHCSATLQQLELTYSVTIGFYFETNQQLFYSIIASRISHLPASSKEEEVDHHISVSFSPQFSTALIPIPNCFLCSWPYLEFLGYLSSYFVDFHWWIGLMKWSRNDQL